MKQEQSAVAIVAAAAIVIVLAHCAVQPLSSMAASDDFRSAPLAKLQEAAAQGNAQAQYWLGTRLIKGLGVAQNTKLAVDCFKKSADQNFAPAITSLAELYDDGVGFPENPKEATRLYQKAVTMREPRAEWKMGERLMIEKSLGGLGDLEAGIKLLKQAANDGSLEAAVVLGKCYWLGNQKGISRDDKEALKFFKQAEEAGSTSARFYLIKAYYEGGGTPKDLRVAITYFAKGVASPEGRRWYKRLSSQANTSVEELKRAQQWMLATDREQRLNDVNTIEVLDHR